MRSFKKHGILNKVSKYKEKTENETKNAYRHITLETIISASPSSRFKIMIATIGLPFEYLLCL